jgi:hypothetical protein
MSEFIDTKINGMSWFTESLWGFAEFVTQETSDEAKQCLELMQVFVTKLDHQKSQKNSIERICQWLSQNAPIGDETIDKLRSVTGMPDCISGK